MSFSDVVESLKSLSLEEKEEIQTLLACIIHERIEKKPESLMPSGRWRFDPHNSLYFLSITNY